ncbi:MAG TPA: hypothetical protein VN026_07565 [Bacteroidia bacterium]|jgi:hypothetical protein|nr:hypothetical protein [Bacteroidia bacterium]
MADQAVNNTKEVAAVRLCDGSYFVQPWDNNYNDETRSRNNFNTIPGYYRADVEEQYHSHPDSSGPSHDDAYNSYFWKIPVNVFSNDGNVWQVQYNTIPPMGMPGTNYGTWIYNFNLKK